MRERILQWLNIIPYEQIKKSNGMIYNYYRNGKVKLTLCDHTKCDKCECKS